MQRALEFQVFRSGFLDEENPLAGGFQGLRLIDSADRAMYAAKKQGKGRVILHGRLTYQAP